VGSHEHFVTPAFRSSTFSLSLWKGSPGLSGVSPTPANGYRTKGIDSKGKPTANLFAKSEQLPYRELGTFDAAKNRPLAVILDGSGDNVREVLHRSERDTVIVTSIQREGSAFIEINLSFKRAEVFG
jgi:hypothetical protein